jgi:hypothetical protein
MNYKNLQALAAVVNSLTYFSWKMLIMKLLQKFVIILWRKKPKVEKLMTPALAIYKMPTWHYKKHLMTALTHINRHMKQKSKKIWTN